MINLTQFISCVATRTSTKPTLVLITICMLLIKYLWNETSGQHVFSWWCKQNFARANRETSHHSKIQWVQIILHVYAFSMWQSAIHVYDHDVLPPMSTTNGRFVGLDSTWCSRLFHVSDATFRWLYPRLSLITRCESRAPTNLWLRQVSMPEPECSNASKTFSVKPAQHSDGSRVPFSTVLYKKSRNHT